MVRHGAPCCHADHRFEPLFLAGRHHAVCRAQHHHPTRTPLGSSRKTNNNPVRVQSSPAAQGVSPRPLALQEKTSARSAYRVAAWICKTTPRELRGTETALSEPDYDRLKTSNLVDPSDETECAAPMPSQLHAWCGNSAPNFDPSPEQTAATSTRFLELTLGPYAHFSQLTPFGRRFQKRAPPSILAFAGGRVVFASASSRASHVGSEGRVGRVRIHFAQATCGQRRSRLACPPEAYFYQLPGHRQGVHRGAAPLRISTRRLSARKGQSPPLRSEVFVAALEDDEYRSRACSLQSSRLHASEIRRR